MAIYYLHIVHSIVAKEKGNAAIDRWEDESYNKKKFNHICKNKFYDVDDRDDNSNNDSDDDNNGENFMSEGFILTLQDLTIVIIIIVIIIMAMMMITFMKNLMSESFMVMLQDVVM